MRLENGGFFLVSASQHALLTDDRITFRMFITHNNKRIWCVYISTHLQMKLPNNGLLVSVRVAMECVWNYIPQQTIDITQCLFVR